MGWGNSWGPAPWGDNEGILQPIALTAIQNRFLQSIFTEIYQDDRIRSLEGPALLILLNKIKDWPAPLILTEQEDRRLQYELEKFEEISKPYPYPYYPTTFGQDTRQLVIIHSILQIMEAAR